MKEIILIGGGGHCKSVIDVIEQESQFVIVGIVDKSELIGTDVLGYPVIGSDSDLESLAKIYTYALITVGQIRSPEARIKLFDLAKKAGFSLPRIISSRAYASNHTVIGDGTVVMHDAFINAGVSIGDNCIINSKGVMTRPMWTLMNKLKMFQGSQCAELSNAEWLAQRIVNIPSSMLIT